MITWDEAHNEWKNFLDVLRDGQSALHCSYRNAWFRGHEDLRYLLLPSALRSRQPPGIGPLWRMNGGAGPQLEDLRRPMLLPTDGIELLDDKFRLLEDRKLDSEASLETDVRVNLRELRTELAARLNATVKADKELKDLRSLLNGQKLDHGYRSILLGRQRELKIRLSDLRSKICELRDHILSLRSIFYGERDSFLVFRQHSATVTTDSSTWLVLAAMQHHGVPTRLLDWTTSAGVAIFFAVKTFRETMVKREGSIPNWLEHNASEINLNHFIDLPEPTVWVLNPFFLARQSTSYNRIEDPSLRTDLDYLRRFHETASWPYNGAMPAIIPWRSERLFAQRGTFTIHGRDTRPLEEQVRLLDIANLQPLRPGTALTRVQLSRAAAVYGVRHLVHFIGLDQFTVFRGEDDLGKVIRDRNHQKRATQ